MRSSLSLAVVCLLTAVAARGGESPPAERVAVYGGSYGGYMVLASLVHYSERLRAGNRAVEFQTVAL